MAAVIEQPQVNPNPIVAGKPSLIAKFAARFGVEPNKMLTTLKATAFRVKEGPEPTNEQLMALLIVADQYGLNPWTKEIYAFPDKHNGIVPVVGVDGWSRIINEHPQFDGMEFVDGPVDAKTNLPEWIECLMHRKDRAHPTRAREYMVECKRGTQPWQTHPRRMLRHKSLMQCARIAFGFVGIYDEDEAQRIVDAQSVVMQNDAIDALNATIKPALQNAPSETLAPAKQSEVVDATIVEKTAETVATADLPEAGASLESQLADFRTAVADATSVADVAAAMEKAAALPNALKAPEYKALADFAGERIKKLGKEAKAAKS